MRRRVAAAVVESNEGRKEGRKDNTNRIRVADLGHVFVIVLDDDAPATRFIRRVVGHGGAAWSRASYSPRLLHLNARYVQLDRPVLNIFAIPGFVVAVLLICDCQLLTNER